MEQILKLRGNNEYEIKGFLVKPYDPPQFSCHTQSTERCVKLVIEAAAAVCGQVAGDGYAEARMEHREAMPIFTKKSISWPPSSHTN